MERRVSLFIYIYIYRERKREREGNREKEADLLLSAPTITSVSHAIDKTNTVLPFLVVDISLLS